jgi:heme/copper-type cytochrome/quinol oxidase subunit 2
MNRWDLFTYIAVVLLVTGSTVVFVWFFRDARRILREMEKDPEEMAGNPQRPGPVDGPDSPRGPGGRAA